MCRRRGLLFRRNARAFLRPRWDCRTAGPLRSAHRSELRLQCILAQRAGMEGLLCRQQRGWQAIHPCDFALECLRPSDLHRRLAFRRSRLHRGRFELDSGGISAKVVR